MRGIGYIPGGRESALAVLSFEDGKAPVIEKVQYARNDMLVDEAYELRPIDVFATEDLTIRQNERYRWKFEAAHWAGRIHEASGGGDLVKIHRRDLRKVWTPEGSEWTDYDIIEHGIWEQVKRDCGCLEAGNHPLYGCIAFEMEAVAIVYAAVAREQLLHELRADERDRQSDIGAGDEDSRHPYRGQVQTRGHRS